MAPIIVNTVEPMSRTKVVAVKDDSDKLLKVLQKAGMLHIEESHELHPLDRARIETEHREINELFTQVNKILGYVPEDRMVTIDEDIEVIYTQPYEEIRSEIKKIYNRTSRLQDRIEAINNEYISLDETYKYLKPLSGSTNLTLKDLNYTGNTLISRVVVVNKEFYASLKNACNDLVTENVVVELENETVIHIIANAKHVGTIENIITNNGGIILNIPNESISLNEYLNSGSGKMSSLEIEKQELVKELNDIIGEDLKKLVMLREALTAENDRLSVLEKASEAKYVTVVEGWVPKRIADDAMAQIKESIDYAFIDVREPMEGEEPPSAYKNPKAFKPFQIIVNLFATPKYGEWDPTPIITYSFAFFFGLMVCDVLYAIGIFFLVKYMLDKFVDDPKSPTVVMFKRLLYICCGVAFVGGILTGQYFANIYEFAGLDNFALSTAIRDVLQDPVMFIVIALGIGFVHVNIGHILAFIKGIKERDKGVIINKIGLCMIQFGLPTIVHGVLAIDIPGFTPTIYSILMYVMLAGLVLVIIANLISNGGLGAIMWLFDVTGILGDLMSYTRLAGVGLATFYLASTFNLIATTMMDLMGDGFLKIVGIILAIVIVLFGHAVNMVLTAIGGFMHSLRLCFVEFLSKFYEGGGTEYSPFKLRKRTEIPVTIKN